MQPTQPDQALDLLPHRDPFRFVSRLTGRVPGSTASGVWEVDGSEWFFQGHFPGDPIVPGALIGEALAQISGLAAFTPGDGTGARLARLDIKIEAPVRPPATIGLSSTLQRALDQLMIFDVAATCDAHTVAKGSIVLTRPRR